MASGWISRFLPTEQAEKLSEGLYISRSVALDFRHLIHPMSPSPPSSSSHAETLLSLKRRIAALEELNAELCTPAERKRYVLYPRTHCKPLIFNSNSQVLEGRVIRRLVCLTERVEDLVSEFDRRTTLGTTDGSDAEAFESSNTM